MSGQNGSGVRNILARILIVDDDVALAEAIGRALENDGYVVRVVNNGGRALEAVALFVPDLVVLDVMMPVVDGWQVLTQLRANPGTEGVPVVMLTAADTSEAKVRGFGLGADDYLTKPFKLQELRCRIAAVLRRSRPDKGPSETCTIPVVTGRSDMEFVRCRDVVYVEGVRNYSYVHTAGTRFLCRVPLGAIEDREIEGFRRIHRSYIVNMAHVKGCGWATKSSYCLRLADRDQTEVPVSRKLVPDIRALFNPKP